MISGEPVVVTGLGAFGAGGRDVAELWENARLGRVAAQFYPLAGRSVAVYRAPAPVHSREDLRLVRRAGRCASVALTAAREAWRDAGLTERPVDPARIGLIVGSSRGPADIVDASASRSAKRPSDSVYTAFSSTAGLIASALNITGCALSLSATCTSGAAAIYLARQLLLAGEFDVVIAGGADAPLIDSILERMAATGVLSLSQKWDAALRPFDLHRDGTVLGEGAAFLVLESAVSATRRRAPVHGTLLGAAISAETGSRTRPSAELDGLRRAVQSVLTQSSRGAEAIDLVHAHGTGTRLNDQSESACLHSLFGAPARQPVCWGSKAITGHTLGGSSSFQAVLTLLAMRHSFLPGTVNHQTPDPACPVRLSLGRGAPMPIKTALCITSGFWGKNSCLLFG